MFHNYQKKPVKTIVITASLIILCSLFLFAGVFLNMKQEESSTRVVKISSSEKRTLVFYKDDCPYCQKVFPELYLHNLWNDDLLFINLNQPKNKLYATQFDVKKVPTLIAGDDRYQGTEKEKIQRLLNKQK